LFQGERIYAFELFTTKGRVIKQSVPKQPISRSLCVVRVAGCFPGKIILSKRKKKYHASKRKVKGRAAVRYRLIKGSAALIGDIPLMAKVIKKKKENAGKISCGMLGCRLLISESIQPITNNKKGPCH
jgi:hypothetical protein